MDERTDYARLIRNLLQALGRGGLNRDQPRGRPRSRPLVNAARRDQPTSSRREERTGDTMTSTMFTVTQTQKTQQTQREAVIRPQPASEPRRQPQGVAPSVTPLVTQPQSGFGNEEHCEREAKGRTRSNGKKTVPFRTLIAATAARDTIHAITGSVTSPGTTASDTSANCRHAKCAT